MSTFTNCPSVVVSTSVGGERANGHTIETRRGRVYLPLRELECRESCEAEPTLSSSDVSMNLLLYSKGPQKVFVVKFSGFSCRCYCCCFYEVKDNFPLRVDFPDKGISQGKEKCIHLRRIFVLQSSFGVDGPLRVFVGIFRNSLK